MSGPVIWPDTGPLRGSTGLCHNTTAAIDEAARWYAANREVCPHPIVPYLKRRFGLSTVDTLAAMKEARRIGA